MERFRRRGKTIGFVPTMGALHEGHLSLVRAAKRENQIVVVSIFVNPLQFGPKEDLKRYPRNLSRDRALLSKEKADYLFIPSSASFYPRGFQTGVEVPELGKELCGRFRPGHFRGVTTVVAKLFNLVQPHRAYFGAKDYQQATLIRQMVHDLNLNLKIKVLPTQRDKDGLALSSRNAYLSSAQRQSALSIFQSLEWLRKEVKRGHRNVKVLKQGVSSRLRRALDRVDYIEFVGPENLQGITKIKGDFVAAIAGWVGKTRLIDNAIIRAH